MKSEDNPLPYHCPPGLLGAALLFWGWQSHWMVLGAAMALVVEAARWLPWRLPLTETHFIHIADATSIAMILAGLSFFAINLADGLFYLVQWLPVIIVILLCAQLYSEQQIIPFKAIVATLRKKPQDGSSPATIDIQLPYFFLTLVSASIATSTAHTFYFTTGLLIVWALWRVRSRRYHPALWLGFVSTALAIGFVFHIGLYQLQGVIQEITTQWLEDDWSNRDLNRNTTAIGQIGRLKLSEEIVMRIHSSDPIAPGAELLLQQAQYSRYTGGTWFADNHDSQFLPKDSTGKMWFLTAHRPRQGKRLTVATYLARGEGILALPRGSYAIADNTSAILSRSTSGAISVENASKLLNYVVYYQPAQPQAPAPAPHDLEVPDSYTHLMAGIVSKLGLATMQPEQAVQTLQYFFQRNFRYSLIQNESDLRGNPLHYFLLQGRQGHCEYFATAGVLLLRAAGIPARYVTGFAMTEYDAHNDVYLVRKRHAHAWTLAYVNGKWRELDFTPSTWAAMEAQAAPWWQGGYDLFSNMVFAFNQWWLTQHSLLDYLVIFIVVGTTIFLLSKLKRKKLRLKFNRRATQTTSAGNHPGQDSPFYRIIHHLETTVAPRHTGEPLKHWLQRLERTTTLDSQALGKLLTQHYIYRFSTCNQEQDKLTAFSQEVEQWLARNSG